MSHRRDSLGFRWPFVERWWSLRPRSRRGEDFLKGLDTCLSPDQTTIRRNKVHGWRGRRRRGEAGGTSAVLPAGGKGAAGCRWRRCQESNLGSWLCRPPPCHLATPPRVGKKPSNHTIICRRRSDGRTSVGILGRLPRLTAWDAPRVCDGQEPRSVVNALVCSGTPRRGRRAGRCIKLCGQEPTL